MSQALVWDLPTRLFHALLAAGFIASFGIAQFAGEHSPWFPVHMMIGIGLGAVLACRVAWGFIGARYARYRSFLYTPAALFSYLRGAIRGTSPRYAGHNPGSAYATWAMFMLIAALVVTGLLMTAGNEAAEELHAPLAYAMAAVAAIHVAGVLLHSWRHRENLALSMVTGRKNVAPEETIGSSRRLAAAVFAVLIIVVTAGLFRNFDQHKGETTLPIVGIPIHLGESHD